MDSKVLTVRPPQPLPPLSSRMHCAMKMMNDLQWGDRVLFWQPGDGSCTGCIYSSREATKQGGSALLPRSHSTSVSCWKQLLRAAAFTVHPSSLHRTVNLSRAEWITCSLSGSLPQPGREWPVCNWGSWGPLLLPYLSFCRERSQQKGP